MAAGLGFKTFTTGEVLTAADTNGYLMQGIWVFATAAARDAAVTSPQEGNACYLKDSDALQTYNGSAWIGAPTTWTPTLQNMTLGNGTVTAQYVQVGKIVTCLFRFVLGSTSAVASFPGHSLPVTARSDRFLSANVHFLDSGTAEYAAFIHGNGSATTGTIYYLATNNALTNVTASAPFTWATGDAITTSITYEVA